MGRYKTKRPGPHPVAVIEKLIQATEGIKDGNVELDAGLPQGYISKLRQSALIDPQISSLVKLAKALGYRITLAPEKQVAPSPDQRIVKRQH